jgi:uncharacterized protein YkwD
LTRCFLHILAVAVSTAAVVAFPPAASAAGDCTPDAGWPAPRPDLAAQVLDLVNAHRAELGLAPLAVSPTLTAAATWKAQHMAAFGYLSHDDPAPPTARSPGERLAACGYPGDTWGENIAMGYATARDAFDAWLASPEHRANIERPDFVATGIAVAGTQQPYWAQSFGAVLDATSPAPAPESLGAASATARSSSTRPAASVTCARSGQRVACRVRHARGATLRIAIRRGGRTYARARARVQSDDLRMRLHEVRRLRAGRYALVIRTSAPSGTREQRLAFVVR